MQYFLFPDTLFLKSPPAHVSSDGMKYFGENYQRVWRKVYGEEKHQRALGDERDLGEIMTNIRLFSSLKTDLESANVSRCLNIFIGHQSPESLSLMTDFGF